MMQEQGAALEGHAHGIHGRLEPSVIKTAVLRVRG